MAIQRVTILEFAPTADEIWCISQHDRDGYACYDAENGLVSILDTAHHAKPRPEIVTTYAGGKATNVARVLDRLLIDEKELYVELITFLPPPPQGPLRELEFAGIPGDSLRPSTAAGVHVQCLQIAELCKVRPRFEVVDELEESGEMQTTRCCIEITLKEGGGSLNFSPRIMWSQEAAEAVRSRVAEVARNSDLVVMAGSPPKLEDLPGRYFTSRNFYAKVIDALEPDCQVSIDTRGQYLHECLNARRMPRFAFMNTEEFSDLTVSYEELSRMTYTGTLLVHDERGCWVWDGKLPNGRDPFSDAEHFPSVPVPRLCSTIGAGDALHAGFLKEWMCTKSEEQRAKSLRQRAESRTQDARQEQPPSIKSVPRSTEPYAPRSMPLEERLSRAVVYGQVVAAVAVSSEKATHGIDARVVEGKFRRIWEEVVSDQ